MCASRLEAPRHAHRSVVAGLVNRRRPRAGVGGVLGVGPCARANGFAVGADDE